MTLWAMPCSTTQDRWVMVESWQNIVHWRLEQQSTSLFLPWESHEQYERQKDRTLKDELTRSVGAQYATGEEQRNSSRKNEEAEPKWKQCPVVDASGGESNVRCFNCIISLTEHTSGYKWLRCHYNFSFFQPAPTVLRMCIYSCNTWGSTPLHRNICFLRMSNALPSLTGFPTYL